MPPFTPAAPANIRDAFDHDDYIFELKMDGFRARAQVGPDETRLVSRRGNVYKRFTELAAAVHVELDCEAVLDGEIVRLDGNGRPRFYDLLRRRGEPVSYAFDLLWLEGEDLRSRPLIERNWLSRSIVPGQPSVMLYAGHIERTGIEFFRLACERDLEGIGAKAKPAAYSEKWFKSRNPRYAQYEGRRDLFERKRAATAATITR